MTQYINTQTQVTCTESEIRQAFSNTSFPTPFNPPEDYAVVFPAPQPAYDPISQSVRQTAPVLTDKGHWEQTWEVVALDQETVTANQIASFAAKVKSFDSALTNHFDDVAKSKEYDNRITCALRAGYTGPFQAEGQAFASWMDACNVAAYTLLAAVKAGTQSPPETPEEFLASLPPMVWPE